jgi:hypothetical protein
VRHYLAWTSIVDEKDTRLNLNAFQARQAENQKKNADDTVDAQMCEAYQWLLVPEQAFPAAKIEFKAYRLSGKDSLAVRAAKKMKNEDRLATAFAGSRLKMDMDNTPLWRGNNVSIAQLEEDYAQYL